jgi:Na+-transporting NADH:ubiquinone oxidoreductase subunit NqrF
MSFPIPVPFTQLSSLVIWRLTATDQVTIYLPFKQSFEQGMVLK